MPAAAPLLPAAEAQDVRAWRRHLHQHPELSGDERETSEFVAARLREFGYAPRTRVGGGYGLIAELPGPDGAPWIALRADMDALPIVEETGREFASQTPGVMHACGHDAHTAMLLGAARWLAARRADLRVGVRFLFQPHEELYPGGAPQMIAAGALDGVVSVFGLHITTLIPTGQIGFRAGPFMAAVNNLSIIVHGRGGHAAMPESACDPVPIAAQIILALQTIASRNLGLTEMAVVTVTQLEAGTAHNVIPETVKLGGTVRTFGDAVQQRVAQRITEIANGVCAAHGARVEVEIGEGYPALVNDAAECAKLREILTKSPHAPRLTVIEMDPMGGGEDFAYYAQECPSVFAFLGARHEALQCTYPHHHPRFDVDEAALADGAALYAAYALHAAG